MRKIIEGRLENARLFPSVGRPSGKVYNTNVMKTHLSRAVLLLPLVFLSSCAAPKSVQISDYIDTDVAFKENFRLLQLTDIHWSVNTDPIKQGAYLSKVVEITNPDFIMITGDLLLGATTSTAETLINTISGWNKPFGITWGNHDREGEYSPTWLSNLVSNAKNSHYHELNDDVFGRSNYVISLMNKTTGKAAWNIYSIDSNSYPASSTGLYYDYDVIHDDQVDWFNKVADYSATQNGYTVPGLAYFHIPLWQWMYSYLQNQKGLMGEILESSTYSMAPTELKQKFVAAGLPLKFWPGYKDTHFFDAGVSKGVKGFFCGHDHSNDWGGTYSTTSGQSAYVGYGVKSGTELYYAHGSNTRGYLRDYDLIGGSLSTLHGDGTFDLTHYYVQNDAAYTTYTEEVSAL